MMYRSGYELCFVMIGLFARKESLLKVHHQSQNEQGRGTRSYVDASTSPNGFGSTSSDGVIATQSTDVRYVWTCKEYECLKLSQNLLFCNSTAASLVGDCSVVRILVF